MVIFVRTEIGLYLNGPNDSSAGASALLATAAIVTALSASPTNTVRSIPASYPREAASAHVANATNRDASYTLLGRSRGEPHVCKRRRSRATSRRDPERTAART